MEEYVSGRPMYTRSCNFSGHMFEQLDKAAQGVCFNKCCETILTDKEFLVRAAEDNALLLAHPHVAGSTIGHCDNGFGFLGVVLEKGRGVFRSKRINDTRQSTHVHNVTRKIF